MRSLQTVLCVSCMVFSFVTHGQSAIITSGGDASSAAGSISFSIGQVADEHYDASGVRISEGVQQPYEFFTVSISEALADVTLSIFPNPTMSTVSIQMGTFQDGLSVSIFDLQGSLLYEAPLQNVITPIDMQSWAAASYIVRVKNTQNTSSEYLVVKH